MLELPYQLNPVRTMKLTAPEHLSWTLTPPAGAGPFNVTTPPEVSPAFSVAGIEMLAGPNGSTERDAVTLAATYVAVRMTGVETETGVVEMLKVAP